MTTIYKIRHKETGLYRLRSYGLPGKWHKVGKAWVNLAHVKLHLNLLRGSPKEPLPEEVKNWEVVAFEIRESENLSIEELWKK